MKGIRSGRNEKRSLVIIVGMAVGFLGAGVFALGDTPVAACGYVIGAPGNYGVVADLNCPGTAITINASNVSLKLNGHIITGPSTSVSPPSYGISVNPGGAPRLIQVGVAGPGLIRNFYDGIRLNNIDYSQVSQITASQNSFGLQSTSTGTVTWMTIGSNNFVANQNDGLELAPATNSTISNNDLSGNMNWGLTMWAGSANTISNNVASGNGLDGLYFSNNYSRVSSNVTDGNGRSGIAIYLAVMVSRTPAVGNEIFSNTSSVGNMANDLDDQNPQGSNLWSNNVFFTANQTWIH